MVRGHARLQNTNTDLDALVPRMTELGVTSTPAVSEPGTAATTTTNFPRFLDDAAFEAHGTDGRRPPFWYFNAGIDQRQKEGKR